MKSLSNTLLLFFLLALFYTAPTIAQEYRVFHYLYSPPLVLNSSSSEIYKETIADIGCNDCKCVITRDNKKKITQIVNIRDSGKYKMIEYRNVLLTAEMQIHKVYFYEDSINEYLFGYGDSVHPNHINLFRFYKDSITYRFYNAKSVLKDKQLVFTTPFIIESGTLFLSNPKYREIYIEYSPNPDDPMPETYWYTAKTGCNTYLKYVLTAYYVNNTRNQEGVKTESVPIAKADSNGSWDKFEIDTIKSEYICIKDTFSGDSWGQEELRFNLPDKRLYYLKKVAWYRWLNSELTGMTPSITEIKYEYDNNKLTACDYLHSDVCFKYSNYENGTTVFHGKIKKNAKMKLYQTIEFVR